jgi:hypothetical protein
MVKNIALFTPLRYPRGVAVLLHSILALALNGGECSTLRLTNSHPGKQHHYPLNRGLVGLERRSKKFEGGENFLPLTVNIIGRRWFENIDKTKQHHT